VHPSIVVLGSPTALGGHFGGMERTPGALRRAGLIDRLRARPGLAGSTIVDAGDVPNEPGWWPDPDPRAKNRARIEQYLPVLADRVERSIREVQDGRVHALGGDCTTHAGVMAGLSRALRARLERAPRLAIAWFDAHGDFNTPDTTPSGNVWGMPFAMLLGRGDEDLVAACSGPTAREADAALLGGQVLDEQESRMLAASQVSHFGAGMLGTAGGQAALGAWAAVVASRVDGLYVAFDLDAIDEGEGLSLTMPEPGGISLATAVASVAALAAAMPVVGIGTTAAMERDGVGMGPTVEAIAQLAEAALGSPG
jgi:arginase